MSGALVGITRRWIRKKYYKTPNFNENQPSISATTPSQTPRPDEDAETSWMKRLAAESVGETCRVYLHHSIFSPRRTDRNK